MMTMMIMMITVIFIYHCDYNRHNALLLADVIPTLHQRSEPISHWPRPLCDDDDDDDDDYYYYY